MRWQWLGRAPYREAWSRQEELRRGILAGTAAETVLVLEHEPVVTLGRGACATNVLWSAEALAARGIDRVETSRGGDVTVHGPGQLVVYPVVRLRRGLVDHLERCARAIVDELAPYGVTASWRRDPAGVWVDDGKLAACGVHVHRRVAIHGFALNVSKDSLGLFDLIVPCGLAGRRVVCAEALASRALPPLPELGGSLGERLASELGDALA